jgi:TonB-dependent starch-binding outer membrane protein SusC
MRRLIIALIGCLVMVSYSAIAQKTVSGRVTDGTSGEGLPGVTVSVKGSRATTTTNTDGTFSIAVPSDGSVLVFSYVGFEPQEISARSSNFNIILNPAVASIDEVVVTGYRTSIKKDFVGSAGTVKGADVANVPIASFDQAIQGRTPGLLLRAQSGQPGASGSILIRGRASFGGGTEPLFIVDGLRIAGADFSQINPNDIQNITVLKDAVATSIYGSQGANGVIVVTTKRGVSGKPKLEVDAYTGWGRFPTFNDYRLMNTQEKIGYELRRGGTSLEDYSQAELDSLGRINTDWEKETTRTGKTYSVNASASGGSDKTKYFASINYFTQEGSVRNTSFDRITARMNLNQDAGNFSFGLNANGTLSNFQNTSETNTAIGAPLNAGIWTNPYEQPFVFGRYNPAGNFVPGGDVLTRPRIAESFQPIPTTDLYWNNNNSEDIRVIAGVNAEYRIPMVKGLSVRTQYGIDYRQFNSDAFVDRRTYSAGSNPRPTSGQFQNFRTSSFSRGFFQSSRATWTSSLNYNKSFGDHTLDLGAFYETIDAKVNSNGRTVFLLESPFQNEAGATINADLIPRISASGSEASIESFFGLVNYSYKGKYYVSGNVRRDGSSRFGPNNRFATFGGIGVGWIMTEESFMSGTRGWLDLLKFRASYGTVANDGALGAYTWQGTVGNRLYNATQGTIVTVPANPDLRWEGRTKINLGFDFAMFGSRLTGGIDYYNEKTNDLILPNELSRTTGFTNIQQNIGQVKNEGVELNLSYDILRTRDLRINVNGNLTYNDNKITKLADRDTIVSGIIARIVGQPINSLFLVEYGGVNPENGASLYRKLDGTTTESRNLLNNERRVVGMGDPNLFGGFGFDVNYKGLSLNSQFNYQFGSSAFNNERNNIENPAYYYDNMNADLLGEWQRPGDITNIPSPNNPFFSNTTRFVEDNSFVRLRNITLSYTLPAAMISKLKLSQVTIYASGTNLLTWTNWRGRDPEFAQSGVLTGGQYPALRTTQLGLRVGF